MSSSVSEQQGCVFLVCFVFWLFRVFVSLLFCLFVFNLCAKPML